jgi:hypothetical protein
VHRSSLCSSFLVGSVIPEALKPREISGDGSTFGEQRVVRDMHERKAEMAALADAFIALPGEWTRGGCNRRGSAKRVDLCKVCVAVAFLKSWSKHTGKNSDCCPHLTQEAQAVVKLLRLTDARAYCCRGVRHSGRAAGDDHLVAAGDPCQAGTPCPIHQPLQQSVSVLW